jgi:hypothetical protein
MKLKYAFISALVIVSSNVGCSQKIQPILPIQNDRPIIIYVNDDQSIRPAALRRIPQYTEDSLSRHNSKPKLLKPYMPELEDENHICEWVPRGKFSVKECKTVSTKVPELKEIKTLDGKPVNIKCTGDYYLNNSQELAIIKKGFRKCPSEIVEKIKCNNLNSNTANFGCVYEG